MNVLVTCKNEEDLIKNEGARVVTRKSEQTYRLTEGRRLDGYTISSPCEPSAQVS